MWTGLGYGLFGAALGAGLAIVGAGLGIGRIAAAACDSSARQPEVAGRAFTTMLISCAMIEGVAFFAVLTCFLMNNQIGAITAKAAEDPSAFSAPVEAGEAE